MEDHFPIAFTSAVQKVTAHLRQNAVEPQRVVVLFGEGSMEEVPIDLLRRLFSITRLWDVAVEFPERPGAVAGMIDVTAEAEDDGTRWSARWVLSPELLCLSA